MLADTSIAGKGKWRGDGWGFQLPSNRFIRNEFFGIGSGAGATPGPARRELYAKLGVDPEAVQPRKTWTRDEIP